jgi:hypothetical protein
VEEGGSVGEHRVDVNLLDVRYVADRVTGHIEIAHMLQKKPTYIASYPVSG